MKVARPGLVEIKSTYQSAVQTRLVNVHRGKGEIDSHRIIRSEFPGIKRAIDLRPEVDLELAASDLLRVVEGRLTELPVIGMLRSWVEGATAIAYGSLDRILNNHLSEHGIDSIFQLEGQIGEINERDLFRFRDKLIGERARLSERNEISRSIYARLRATDRIQLYIDTAADLIERSLEPGMLRVPLQALLEACDKANYPRTEELYCLLLTEYLTPLLKAGMMANLARQTAYLDGIESPRCDSLMPNHLRTLAELVVRDAIV